MKYENVKEGIFIARPNRFIGEVLLDGKKEKVHVKNTGRCKELLIEGARVFLAEASNPERKTKYDLIAVYKDLSKEKGLPQKEKSPHSLLVNLDSQAPNTVFYEYAAAGHFVNDIVEMKREKAYKDSRLDLYIKTKGKDRNIGHIREGHITESMKDQRPEQVKEYMIEIKGVTLEENGLALFPDAPTERGIKHIRDLIKAKEEGYEAYIVFIIQMEGMKAFSPNRKTHPEFGQALDEAKKAGVNILALEAKVTRDSLFLTDDAREIPVRNS